jgi:hypothetical protein
MTENGQGSLSRKRLVDVHGDETIRYLVTIPM